MFMDQRTIPAPPAVTPLIVCQQSKPENFLVGTESEIPDRDVLAAEGPKYHGLEARGVAVPRPPVAAQLENFEG
jgi:hypothetical protein